LILNCLDERDKSTQ